MQKRHTIPLGLVYKDNKVRRKKYDYEARMGGQVHKSFSLSAAQTSEKKKKINK